jgi:hypothetical protein
MLFTVSSSGGFYRKPYSTPVLKIKKKIAKQEDSSLFMNSILQNGKMRVKNLRKTRVYAQVFQEFKLCVHF